MYGIPVIDVQTISVRHSRSALPKAPVLEDVRKRTTWGGRARRTTLGSRHG
jgi:hypothetical protein